MKRTTLLFFSLLWLCNAVLAQENERTLLKGFVISSQDAGIIPLANLLNRSSGQRAISNRQGLFRIPVFPEDTLQFSVIGYDPLVMKASELIPANAGDTIKVMMISKSYQLKDVNIVYSNRRRDSIARAAAEFLKTDPLMNNYDRIFNRPRGSGFNGVITEMYYQFSKAGKDMVHFEEFVAYMKEQQEIDKKYNRENVKKISGIPDIYLDELMIHCRPEHDFAMRTGEYDMLVYIKSCAEGFKARKGIN